MLVLDSLDVVLFKVPFELLHQVAVLVDAPAINQLTLVRVGAEIALRPASVYNLIETNRNEQRNKPIH
jgi:hypothetical protein